MTRKSALFIVVCFACAASAGSPLTRSPRAAGAETLDPAITPATARLIDEIRKSCRYRSAETGPGFCELAFGG